jgi:hypothetical protein
LSGLVLTAALGLVLLGVGLLVYVLRKVYGSLPDGTVEGLGHLYRGGNLWIALAGMLALAGGLAILIDLLPESWQFWLGGS